jgi:signal transduction histidine kinase
VTDHPVSGEIEPALPLVFGEDLYLEQVVRNFMSNAAKYSPPGAPITLAAAAEDDGVAVRVTDAGPGLAGQSPDQLFELFYRSPDAINRAAGAGIGLFVCRELIHAMGGRIWTAPASTTGRAEFGFWLPAAADLSED